MNMKTLRIISLSALATLFLGACASAPTEEIISERASAEAERAAAEAESRKTRQAKVEQIEVTGIRQHLPESSEEVEAPQAHFESGPRIYTRDDAVQIFEKYRVNPTISTLADPLSTFAMDVDSGSYHLAKSSLTNDNLPNSAGIRVEEFVNAFTYQHSRSDDAFSIGAQVFPSPFRKGYQVLHLNIQTNHLSDTERLNNNLVLVADTSGSMASDEKMDLLKKAFITLVSQLDSDDQIAIVSYSDKAKVVMPPTRVKNKRAIYKKINRLRADGSTNAQAGIALAYQIADEMFAPGFNNRVVLTSDGMANSGSTDPEYIIEKIQASKARGIFLTTVGVGKSMYNDYLLEQLANLGNGHYLYFGNEKDIQTAFIDQLYQQLDIVAKDAKVQVHFEPSAITEYRLLGYENRDLADHEFLSETADGGEIGAGHQVSVIYEIKTSEQFSQQDDFGKIAIAYKKPLGNQVRFFEKPLPVSIAKDAISNAATDSQLAFIVASFAEKLRQSYWAERYQYADLLSMLSNLPEHYKQQAQVKELNAIIFRASQLDNRRSPYSPSTIDFNFDRVPSL